MNCFRPVSAIREFSGFGSRKRPRARNEPVTRQFVLEALRQERAITCNAFGADPMEMSQRSHRGGEFGPVGHVHSPDPSGVQSIEHIFVLQIGFGSLCFR